MLKNQTDINYEWFMENLEEISKIHKNRFIVIQHRTILSSFSSYNEAHYWALNIRNLKPDTFSIQHCNFIGVDD